MTKKKSAKRAFISSFMSFIMCFAMLAGTTFAWYTDSVTSSGNKIIAGTLDIELWMYEPDTSVEGRDAEGYVNISESGAPIFQSANLAQNSTATLWEPGKTQVAYLKIKNNGDLALKYSVAIDVRNIAKDLYKVMKYAIVPDATQAVGVSSWTGIPAASVTSVVPGTNPTGFSDITMPKEAVHAFALVIHMDEEAGNEYMAGEVDFDLRVLATQEAYEADSFGTDYDANAEYPPAPLLINTTTSGNHDSAAQEAIVIEDVSAISTIPAETTVTTATITGGSASTGKLSRAIATTPGDNSVTYDISYSYTTTTTSGTETTSTTEAVTAFSNIVVNNLNIGPNLANVTVTHSHTGSNPVPMTALASADTDAEGYYYDYVTGVLTIKSMTYSDFIVSYTKKIDVSSVTISGDATVETGSTLALAATVLPANASYKDVAWTSSDAAVATVDANGVVTGVAEGSVTITATADGHSATFDVSVFPAGCVYISDVTSLQLASRKSLNDPKDDVYIVLTGDIIFDSPDDFVVKTDNRYCNLIVMNRDVTINLNGHNIRATENAFIPERENAGDVPKMILIYKASLTIIGEGNVVTENQGIAVDSFQDSTVNIYGGNYVSNSHIRTESAVYVNKGTASINVYGGTFMDSNYAFNVHDDYGGKIVIHEGVSFKEFSEANSTQLIASDISHNRIKAADGCYFKTSEIGGQTVYEVALIGE